MEFQYLKRVIAKHGERVKWQHKRDVVLFDGLFAYWREGGVINRTYRLSYLNGGRPPEKVLAKMKTVLAEQTRPTVLLEEIANEF
jgi:hypothetical protein